MLAQRIVTIARRRGLCILWSGRASDAVRMGADGVHAAHGRKLPLRSRHPHLIRSVPVHTLRERRKAEQHGADIIFLSPVFATRTHPGAVPLRPMQASALARGTRLPVIALGGMTPRRAIRMQRLGFTGWAGIDTFLA